jgi:hypothetical protein
MREITYFKSSIFYSSYKINVYFCAKSSTEIIMIISEIVMIVDGFGKLCLLMDASGGTRRTSRETVVSVFPSFLMHIPS